MADNPMHLIHQLQKRIKEVAAGLGLSLEHTMWVPGLDPTDHTILQVFVRVTDESILSEDEQVDKEFDSIVSGLDSDDPLGELRERLRRDMEAGGLGFDET